MGQTAPPPMENSLPMTNDSMETPMDGMDAQPEQNQFDTNFDAGVEANEDEDPKKYIQQLTGKLSQKLRSYNESLPQPDVDLNKFVAGMIVKQAVDGLSPDDTNEILNKVKGDEEENSNQTQEQPEIDDDNRDFDADVNIGENTNKSKRQKIDEIFSQVMKNDNDEHQLQKPITNIGYKKKPFTSPNFK